MSKKKKYYDLAEERALTIPVIMWRYCAYKTEKDYESGKHYFVKDFLDHTEMKVFSGKHSAKEKPLYSDYCSMYWKIETNAMYLDNNRVDSIRIEKAVNILEKHNKWRRGDESIDMVNPVILGKAIDLIISEMKNRQDS
jgi:hypothetical protein